MNNKEVPFILKHWKLHYQLIKLIQVSHWVYNAGIIYKELLKSSNQKFFARRNIKQES